MASDTNTTPAAGPAGAPSPRNYAIVTAAYWGFTLTDGALRMLVLLHFFRLGYSPFTLALLFLLYEAAGIGAISVQRIWQANGLTPHRMKTFKLSNDPKFAEKFSDVVGLYVDPPAHAVVLSIDEKSQIQALDRTQPGLPMKKGRAGTMTHDYIRNGTTTLFAALNVLDGTVIGRNMQRHRHQEFIRFLNQVEAAVPAVEICSERSAAGMMISAGLDDRIWSTSENARGRPVEVWVRVMGAG